MLSETVKTTITRVSCTLTLAEIEGILIDHLNKPGASYSIDWDDCGEGGVEGATITYETVERTME